MSKDEYMGNLGEDVEVFNFSPPSRPRFSRWHEGHHWQIDLHRFSAWIGITRDRWMLGLVLNWENRSIGVGIGPFYSGIGA